MIPTIVSLYAGILALIYLALSLRVPLMRKALKISVGTGGSKQLERLIRVHGNFGEYVPFILILMLLLELRPAPALLLHVCGIVLVLSRIAHAYGVAQENENLKIRIVAMQATLALLLVLGLLNLYYSFALLLA